MLTVQHKQLRKQSRSRMTYLKKFCSYEYWTNEQKINYIDKFRQQFKLAYMKYNDLKGLQIIFNKLNDLEKSL
jgi:hypothetical protein